MAATVGDIGLGEAFVADFSGLNNVIQRQSQQIAAQYQRRQQQRAKENEELGDLVAKINPNGLRREDIDDYSKRYQSIKDKYVRAISLENETDRRRARAEVQQDLNELNTFVGNSKQAAQAITQLSNTVSTNREMYSDDVISKIRSLSSTPTAKINSEQLNPLNWERKVDDSKVLNDLQKGLGQLVSKLPTQAKVGERIRTGNVTSTQVINEATLNPTIAADYILQSANADPNKEAYLKRKYPELNIGEAARAEAQEYLQLGLLSKANTELIRDRAPRESSSSGSQTSGGSVSYGVPLSYRTTNPDLPSLEIPTARFKAIKSTNTPLAGARGVIDLDNGGRVNLPATFEGDVSGIATVPIIIGGATINGQDAAGELAQEGFVRKNPDLVRYEDFIVVNSSEKRGSRTISRSYLVPADRLSESSKTIREQVASFRNTPLQPISTNQQNSVPSQQRQQFRGVPQGGF